MLLDALFVRLTTLLASLAALASPGTAAIGGSGTSYSTSDLKNYAQALVAVVQVRHALAEQLGQLPQAEDATLRQKADAQIATILSRHDFSVGSFNAMSSRIEQQPALTRQVQQYVGREQVGY